jgi:hypothetical protein
VTASKRPALHRLDEQWVPRLAARMRRLRTWSTHSGSVGTVGMTVAGAMRAQPALGGSIVVVFLASLLLGVFGTGPDNGRTHPQSFILPSTPPTALATIGPAPGTSIPVYLTRASVDLRHYGEIAANRPTYAVIDFRRYLTPDRALRIIGGVSVVRAYVRVPSKLATQPRSVPLTTGSELGTGMLTAATVAKATAKSYAALLKALHPTTRSDRLVKRRYASQRRAAAVETRHLSHPATCACVFAFVVRAGVQQLGTLAHDPAVRVVDPAPPVVSLTGLTVLPLQPDYISVVPRTGLPGG